MFVTLRFRALEPDSTWKRMGSSAKANGFAYARVSFLAEKPGYLPEMANPAVALAKASCFCRSPTHAIQFYIFP